MEFVIGQRWVSHSDANLGLGIVTDISGRRVTLGFPAVDEERTYATDSAPLARVRYQLGDEIETFDGESLTVRAVEDLDGVLMYHAEDANGDMQEVSEVKLGSHVRFTDPRQRLFAGRFDRNGAFRLRMATVEHAERLRQSPARGMIGARTSHLPHQLYIAGEVARRYAPRVLLADEVGLGKTIEAGLILHSQLQNGLAKRVLVVVPDSLVHQWLVEMLRRFNLRFSIVDDSNYELDDAADQILAILGESADDEEENENPFEQSQLVLCSQGFLTRSDKARRDAIRVGWDLMVVDEAHHLGWTPEAASPEYQAIEALAQETRGLLLLTATPEQMGVAGHFARLRLLDPARYHDLAEFQAEEARYAEVNQLVQALQNQGGEPDAEQRQTLAQWLGDDLDALLAKGDGGQALIETLLDRHGTGRVLFRNTRAAIQGFPERRVHGEPLPCPEAYSDVSTGTDGLTPEAGLDEEVWLADDPRVVWLEKKLTELKKEKVVVICAHAATATALEHYLQLRAGIRSTAFHEGLSLVERDRAAAYFTETEQGAQALICSEIGSEGRNFQFAHHLVLFDLPANPDLLEQRIGRLDRIGQGDVIDIHVPYLAGTVQETLFRWYHEGLNALGQSSAVGVAVKEEVADDLDAALNDPSAPIDALIERTREAAGALRQRLQDGRDALIEMNSCRPDQAQALIDAIESEEQGDGLTGYMTEAFDIFGVETEDHTETSDVLKPSDHMLTGQFPELPKDGITVTFDRQQALEREDLAFLSWEHPMVRGVMELMTESELGNAALASLSVKGLPPGTLLLETLFTLHCPAPDSLQLDRVLPLAPLRLLVDLNGKDLSGALPHDRLNELCSNIRRRTAQAVVPQIRAEVETMIDHAEGMAAERLGEAQQSAVSRLRELLQPEIDRLEALRQVNPAIREDEVRFFESQMAAGEAAIDKARMALSGLRVIVSS
ncbi:RNA polymerase-associated protein RapA [Marinobacter sp. JSM 1782161]|uniref:RNA polymerase-associated protein RapA n=1 Tax=Marinobacter sp. JSM 1782161 TaxID=2685906 RepID=UPI0014029A04|nr:RNA polymerase-associated protein RapA [Marinobacter sp. JSM 1782161]